MQSQSRIIFLIPFLGFVAGYFLTYWFMQKTAIPTPNIIGKNLQESVGILSKNCLGVRLLREQEDAVLPEGTVLDQIPKPYQRVRPNQNIFVTVSKKEGLLQVPDFWGHKYQDALETAKKMSIEVKSFYLPSNFGKNSCIAQCPQAGQLFHNKRLLTYFSSGMDALCIMPLFKGLLVKDVRDFLEQNNVEFEIFHSEKAPQDHECLVCKVIEQRPMAGSIINIQKKLVVQLQVES